MALSFCCHTYLLSSLNSVTIDGHKKAIMKTNDQHNELLKKNRTVNHATSVFYSLAKYLTKSIIYQATAISKDNKPDQTNIGLTAHTFKTRFATDKTSFTNIRKRHAAELGKHVCN